MAPMTKIVNTTRPKRPDLRTVSRLRADFMLEALMKPARCSFFVCVSPVVSHLYPRVDERVDDVDSQIEKDEHGPKQQDEALDDGIVSLLNRVDPD